MRIPSADVQLGDIIDIRRTRTGRTKQPKDEVIVTFVDVETRDRISTYARNLSSCIGPDNKPTAGIRPDIPSFLGGVHRALMQYGYDMKVKYKTTPGFRRNIRFEDADHTFVIDMLIPGPDNPRNEWITVDYGAVTEDRKRRAQARQLHHGERLHSVSENQALPSTGGPVSSAGQAGSGAGMGNGFREHNGGDKSWGSTKVST